MIDIMVAGRLCGTPTVRMAFNDKPQFSTFKVEASDNSGQRLLFGCTTHSKAVIEAVQGLSDGDSIAVTGDVDLANWRGCDGTRRRWLNMNVFRVLAGRPEGSELKAGDGA